MKAHTRILDFVFGKIGEEPSDSKLVEWANACETASFALLGAIKEIRTRDIALAERSSQTAECIRKITGALDAIERGELVATSKKEILQ